MYKRQDLNLVKLVRLVHAKSDLHIIVVDDGSDADKKAIFDKLEGLATVLTHEHNQGKGQALKTCLLYTSQDLKVIGYDGTQFIENYTPELTKMCIRDSFKSIQTARQIKTVLRAIMPHSLAVNRRNILIIPRSFFSYSHKIDA